MRLNENGQWQKEGGWDVGIVGAAWGKPRGLPEWGGPAQGPLPRLKLIGSRGMRHHKTWSRRGGCWEEPELLPVADGQPLGKSSQPILAPVQPSLPVPNTRIYTVTSVTLKAPLHQSFGRVLDRSCRSPGNRRPRPALKRAAERAQPLKQSSEAGSTSPGFSQLY